MFFLRHYFGAPNDTLVTLGTQNQNGSLMAVVYVDNLWKQTSLKKKIASILTFKWIGVLELRQIEARKVFMETIFGTEKDYGDKLFNLMAWHNSRVWDLKYLTDTDWEKVRTLQSVCILSRLRHKEATSDYLRLNLFEKAPLMCTLVHPLVVKTPVISIQFAIELDAAYTFNSIREAEHPLAKDLIAYLYETLLIQQRIATSLHRLIGLLNTTLAKAETSFLTGEELDAIKEAGLVITDLKATIKKIMIIIALTYGVADLEQKKTHKAKLAVLEKIIPEREKGQPYFTMVFDLINSEGIARLNNLRTGLVHKRGISDLQPHSYMSKNAKDAPMLRMFDTLIDQHSKNTAAFLGALAFLTDDLVLRKPHNYQPSDIPM